MAERMGPSLDIIKACINVLPKEVLAKVNASLRRELGLPPISTTDQAANQLPTSDVGSSPNDVGTQYNDRPEAAAAGIVIPTGEEVQEQKQPWQMRQAEVIPDYEVPGFNLSANQRFAQQQARRNHEAAVREALQQGRPVPAEVLVEYPDLSTDQLPTSDVGTRNEEVVSSPQLAADEQGRLDNEKLFADTLSEFASKSGISEDEAYRQWLESEKPPEDQGGQPAYGPSPDEHPLEPEDNQALFHQ